MAKIGKGRVTLEDPMNVRYITMLQRWPKRNHKIFMNSLPTIYLAEIACPILV